MYARPEKQHILKPLVVSWGYESEMPSGSKFIDHHEWWGTRDHAAFLIVPAAIRFQQDHEWDEVRKICHEIAAEAQTRICELTGHPPLHPSHDWFAQMTTAPLPPETENPTLKKRLYDEYRIEVPLVEWNGQKLIRISIQGYNTPVDVDKLCNALAQLLQE